MHGQMKSWTIPITCVTIAVVVIGSALIIHGMIYGPEAEKTNWYMEIKTDDLDAASLRAHYSAEYPRDYNAVIADEILSNLKAHPGGQLFHFDTPIRVWRNRGGECGYAIVSRGRIVWRIRFRVS
jgi:hypothetical protein